MSRRAGKVIPRQVKGVATFRPETNHKWHSILNNDGVHGLSKPCYVEPCHVVQYQLSATDCTPYPTTSRTTKAHNANGECAADGWEWLRMVADGLRLRMATDSWGWLRI
jgi:hypothetical protein